jgi:hypothetical protein
MNASYVPPILVPRWSMYQQIADRPNPQPLQLRCPVRSNASQPPHQPGKRAFLRDL